MVARRSFVFLMPGSTITGLPGAPEVYASAQRMARFSTAQLISLAGAEDDGGRHWFEFITGHYFAMAGTVHVTSWGRWCLAFSCNNLRRLIQRDTSPMYL